MSATNRSDVRLKDDFYQTPAWATQAILPRVFDERPFPSIVLDPTAGKGAILREIQEFGKGMLRPRGIELDASRADTCNRVSPCECFDALSGRTWGKPGAVLTNPPFSLALEIAERALAEVFRGPNWFVSLLLPLNWLSSKERLPFHQKNPSDLFVLPRRPSFAVSVKCAEERCTYHTMLATDDPRPTECPTCNSRKLKFTTSDANDYAWYVWGEGRGNRYFHLAA